MSVISAVVDRSPGGSARESLEHIDRRLAHRSSGRPMGWSSGRVALSAGSLSTPAEPAVRAVDGGEVVAIVDSRTPRGSAVGPAVVDRYLRYGERCAEHLDEDASFIVWDGRDESLLVSRDGMGLQPLYYTADENRIAVCTDITGLLACPWVERSLDEEKIADYLGRVFKDRRRTFYRSIRRVEPGTSIRLRGRDSVTFEHWSISADRETRLDSDEDYAARFLELFEDAVRERVEPGRRCGVLLSGGLDSSALLGLVRSRREAWGVEEPAVLSARFPDRPAVDEGTFIETALQGTGLEPIEVSASDTSPLADVDRILDVVGEPFYSPNLFVYWSLARAARDHGVDVLLDGVDGDTTVHHGVERVGELLRAARLGTALAECRALARHFRSRTLLFLWHFGLRPAVVAPTLHGIAQRLGGGVPRPPKLLNRDFVRRVDWRARLRELLGADAAPPTTVRSTHHRALSSDLIPHFLELDDRASAAFGIESRHPYFDRRLVEFCASAPSEQKLSGGWDRVVQRRAVEGLVPPRIQWRTSKSEWGPEFKDGFLVRDRERVEDLVDDPGELGAFVDSRRLKETWSRIRAGRGSDQEVMDCWLAVTLGIWIRRSKELGGLTDPSSQSSR